MDIIGRSARSSSHCVQFPFAIFNIYSHHYNKSGNYFKRMEWAYEESLRTIKYLLY